MERKTVLPVSGKPMFSLAKMGWVYNRFLEAEEQTVRKKSVLGHFPIILQWLEMWLDKCHMQCLTELFVPQIARTLWIKHTVNDHNEL